MKDPEVPLQTMGSTQQACRGQRHCPQPYAPARTCAGNGPGEQTPPGEGTGHSWTRGGRAAAAPRLLLRIPDVALGTCLVLWGPQPLRADSPARGAPLQAAGGPSEVEAAQAREIDSIPAAQPRAPCQSQRKRARPSDPGPLSGRELWAGHRDEPAAHSGPEIRHLHKQAQRRLGPQLRAKPSRALYGHYLLWPTTPCQVGVCSHETDKEPGLLARGAGKVTWVIKAAPVPPAHLQAAHPVKRI